MAHSNMSLYLLSYRHSESNYSNPTSLREVEEGLRLWASYLSRIRCWSYEGWSLVNVLADVSYFWAVSSNEAEALKLTKAAVNQTFAKNVQRATQGE